MVTRIRNQRHVRTHVQPASSAGKALPTQYSGPFLIVAPPACEKADHFLPGSTTQCNGRKHKTHHNTVPHRLPFHKVRPLVPRGNK